MSDYHYVSVTDLTRYVRKLSKFFPNKQAFLDEVEEAIKCLKDSPDNYADEIQFYERVKKNLLTLLEGKKVVKSNNL